jgi:ATP-dependent RNA helicase DDX47/RRP3
VGRTARAGRSGRSIAVVTQYDVEIYQRLEALIGRKLPAYEADEDTVLVLLERVSEAQRLAVRTMREMEANGKGRKGGPGRKRRFGDVDDDNGVSGQTDIDSIVKKFKGRGGGGRKSGGKGKMSGRKGGRRR